jgi:hypothetical protein
MKHIATRQEPFVPEDLKKLAELLKKERWVENASVESAVPADAPDERNKTPFLQVIPKSQEDLRGKYILIMHLTGRLYIRSLEPADFYLEQLKAFFLRQDASIIEG